MIRHFAAILLVALAGLLTACGESTAPTSRDIPGTYHISGINGQRLPYAVDDSLTIVSSSMTLGADDSYRETISYDRLGVKSSQTFAGIYSSDGRLVIIQAEGFSFNLAVSDKTTLVENDANGLIVYKKE